MDAPSSFDTLAFLNAFDGTASRQGFSSEILAQTASGPLQIWTRSATARNASGGTGYISAGMHGDEPAGPRALLAFLEQDTLPTSRPWVLAPLLNPTGMARGTRENGDGIDLNRDFLHRNSREVQALTHWWEQQEHPCALHLSLHEDWEATGLYFYTIDTGSEPCLADRIRGSLPASIALQEQGPVDAHLLHGPGLIMHPPIPDEPEGWPEAIWLARRGPVKSYTFEAPGAFTPDQRVAALRAALTCAVACTACAAFEDIIE